MRRVLFVFLIVFWQMVTPAADQERQSVTMVEVVDGDTIKVQAEGGSVLTVRQT